MKDLEKMFDEKFMILVRQFISCPHNIDSDTKTINVIHPKCEGCKAEQDILLNKFKSFINTHYISREEVQRTIEGYFRGAFTEKDGWKFPKLFTKDEVLELVGEDKAQVEIDEAFIEKGLASTTHLTGYNQAKQEIREAIKNKV